MGLLEALAPDIEKKMDNRMGQLDKIFEPLIKAVKENTDAVNTLTAEIKRTTKKSKKKAAEEEED